jgi:CrcB protein
VGGPRRRGRRRRALRRRRGLGARLGPAFPTATLLVNVSGSLAIGVLAALLTERAAPAWRLLLVVGVLGGYTTFSTYALEAVALAQRGEWGLWYVVGSNGLALAACAAGMALVFPGETLDTTATPAAAVADRLAPVLGAPAAGAPAR